MKPIFGLLRLRTAASDDSRIARFYLLLKGGQNFAFTVPFSKLGLLIKSLKEITFQMASKLMKSNVNEQLEIMEGLADPMTIASITSGRDEATGDKLLWLETVSDGSFAFHLTKAIQDDLRSHLVSHREYEASKKNDAA
jgi:hypothetical protein